MHSRGIRPTFGLEVIAAREQAGLPELIALAMRQHRRDTRLAQRSYATLRGWSKSH